MKDMNGRDIVMGDVVRISGAYFKTDNGLWFVAYVPGFSGWCGKDLSLRRINKNGTVSVAANKVSSWPLVSYVSNPAKRAEARAWNSEHAEIEVVTDVDRVHVKKYFMDKVDETEKQIEYYSRLWGEDSSEIAKMRTMADEYRTVIAGIDAVVSEPEPVSPDDHIKIYWNGIKVDNGKLIRCNYALHNDGSVGIYARDYDRNFPKDLFRVENDSDYYSDYVATDSGDLRPGHPLYWFVRYAAMKERYRHDLVLVKACEKRLSEVERWKGYHEAAELDRACAMARIAAFKAEKDPGQPTAEDLAKIDRMHEAAANAKREAEHKARLAEHEEYLAERRRGREMIEQAMRDDPLAAGAPVVTINWSESVAFAAWNDDELKLSLAAADKIFKALDIEHGRGHGYDKTKFTVNWTDELGDECYIGRYDIGDGDGGLVAHIDAFTSKCDDDEVEYRDKMVTYFKSFF